MRLAGVALCLAVTGCTMCPDPFDYAGPVPNGSTPQNDFAARSNGILPVRATPLPWPPIVQGSAERPTPADGPSGEPAMIAVAPDLSPVIEGGVVPVFGASLVTPVDPEQRTDAGSGGVPDAATDAVRSPEEPASLAETLGVASDWRLTPTPAPTPAPVSPSAPATDDGSAGDASHTFLLDSRLTPEIPSVLLR